MRPFIFLAAFLGMAMSASALNSCLDDCSCVANPHGSDRFMGLVINELLVKSKRHVLQAFVHGPRDKESNTQWIPNAEGSMVDRCDMTWP
ncbi:hypothetical protein N7456_010148 [Penicillium angulare]|uniref:Uncharacterized protein n=1 Tax=Penicillium angulare TaxID=116970 RepID=A0A9W9F659_9EURO|nr:hypothetical protein N7456_010148 [Penicillium angulare]